MIYKYGTKHLNAFGSFSRNERVEAEMDMVEMRMHI